MKRLKNILIAVLSAACICITAIGFVGCKSDCNHEWDSVTVKEATCTEEGLVKKNCIQCGEEVLDEIPLLGHSYKDKRCERCGGKEASQGLTLELNEDKKSYSITGIGTCEDVDLILPDIYNKLLVTRIANGAFKECTNLTSIEIPDTITTIGYRAFYHCENLAFKEFGNCKYLGNQNNSYHALIETVGLNYETYDINKDTKLIADRAFSNCTAVTSIVIPEGVIAMGENVFLKTHCLARVEIPDSLIKMGEYAFSNCSGLNTISVSENNTVYKSIDGNLYTKDGKMLIKYATGKTEKTFKIPDGVTTVGDEAFHNCQGLTNVEIPQSVTSLGKYVFSNCNNLTSVIIPDGITEIKMSTFHTCSNLTSVVIPDNVKKIDKVAFTNCINLKNITFKGTIKKWNAIVKTEDWAKGTTTTVVCNDGTIKIN